MSLPPSSQCPGPGETERGDKGLNSNFAVNCVFGESLDPLRGTNKVCLLNELPCTNTLKFNLEFKNTPLG